MVLRVDSDVIVNPGDLQALRSYLSDKNGDWRLIGSEPDFGTYTLCMDIGDAFVIHKVQLDTEPLFDMNVADETASHGQSFGDGKVIARIPDHLLYSPELGNVGRAIQEGDRKRVGRILNDPDYRKLRCFRGRM